MNVPGQIGNYTLEHPLGRGASSQVWLARHQQLRDHVVAVKLLTDQAPEAVRRFQREAAIAARLRHPHIVHMYDYGVVPPFHYAILEHIDGVTLRERLARQGRLPALEALAIFRQIAQALDYAHGLNVVHCDVSPANILIERQGNRAVLTDFGIARDGNAPVTGPRVVMGTPGYLSPEHANPASLTHLSDIFCLGVVFYHMLAGALPWPEPPGLPGGPPFGPPAPLNAHRVSGVPAAIDGVFARLLALDPAHRFPSAGDAVEALDLLFKRHDQPTRALDTGARAPVRPVELETADPDPAPVEVVLGPELDPEPLQRAVGRAARLRDPAILSGMLDAYAAEGRFGLRRKWLGRLARFHKVTSRNVFFYRLRVLYERRSQLETDEQPDRKAANYPLKPPMDRWAVPLPPAREFADQPGGRVFVPGSTRVVTCDTCAGSGVLVCNQCEGRRRVYAPRPAASLAVGAVGKSDALSEVRGLDQHLTASSPASAESGFILVPCPACNGRGGNACDRCASTGRLVQRQAFHWSRQARAFEGQDEHPALDIEWLLRVCTPEVVYCQSQAGDPRPEWSLVPPLAALLTEARAAENDETRIVLAEVTVSFVPVTDVVFDLGQPGDAGLYRLTIYGFDNRIPPDWRFLNWERVIFISITVVLALVAAILGVFAMTW